MELNFELWMIVLAWSPICSILCTLGCFWLQHSDQCRTAASGLQDRRGRHLRPSASPKMTRAAPAVAAMKRYCRGEWAKASPNWLQKGPRPLRTSSNSGQGLVPPTTGPRPWANFAGEEKESQFLLRVDDIILSHCRKIELEIDFASNSFSNVNNVVYQFNSCASNSRHDPQLEQLLAPTDPTAKPLTQQGDGCEGVVTKKAVIVQRLKKLFRRSDSHPERRLSDAFLDVINLTSIDQDDGTKQRRTPSVRRRLSLQGQLNTAELEVKTPAIASPKRPEAIRRLQDNQVRCKFNLSGFKVFPSKWRQTKTIFLS